jgi:hypothetical protein
MPLSGAPLLLSPALAGAVGVPPLGAVVVLVVGVVVVVLSAPAPFELGLVRDVLELDSLAEPHPARGAATKTSAASAAVR